MILSKASTERGSRESIERQTDRVQKIERPLRGCLVLGFLRCVGFGQILTPIVYCRLPNSPDVTLVDCTLGFNKMLTPCSPD
jgi:hypothetical protein